MLQLVQSPSQRVQRLIKMNCKDGRVIDDDNDEDNAIAANDHKSKSDDKRRSKDDNDSSLSMSKDDDDHSVEASESKQIKAREISSSIISSESSNGRDGRDVSKVRKVVNRDGGVLIAASSYSSSQDRDRDQDDEDNDDIVDDGPEEAVDSDWGKIAMLRRHSEIFTTQLNFRVDIINMQCIVYQ